MQHCALQNQTRTSVQRSIQIEMKPANRIERKWCNWFQHELIHLLHFICYERMEKKYLMDQSFKLVCVLQKEASHWNHISSFISCTQNNQIFTFFVFFTNQIWELFHQLIYHQMLDCCWSFKWKDGGHQLISTIDKYRDLHYTNLVSVLRLGS